MRLGTESLHVNLNKKERFTPFWLKWQVTNMNVFICNGICEKSDNHMHMLHCYVCLDALTIGMMIQEQVFTEKVKQ